MKQNFKSLFIFLKQSLIDDANNRWLFLTFFTLSLLSYIIWNKYLDSLDFYASPRIEVFPVKFLAIIIIINTALGLFSFRKEKEITYLLFIGNVLVSLLVVILEIFYLANL
jgi:hypothetical protein